MCSLGIQNNKNIILEHFTHFTITELLRRDYFHYIHYGTWKTQFTTDLTKDTRLGRDRGTISTATPFQGPLSFTS